MGTGGFSPDVGGEHRVMNRLIAQRAGPTTSGQCLPRRASLRLTILRTIDLVGVNMIGTDLRRAMMPSVNRNPAELAYARRASSVFSDSARRTDNTRRSSTN